MMSFILYVYLTFCLIIALKSNALQSDISILVSETIRRKRWHRFVYQQLELTVLVADDCLKTPNICGGWFH